MQKQILIGKNLNYAASKASTTADTATSPELLRDGAIAFYTSTGTLIPAAGTGMSTATKFFIAQGTSTGCIVTPLLDKRLALKRTSVQDYTAPVKQVSHIGYNGTTGSLNTPTIVAGDEGLVKIIDTTMGRQVFPKQTYSTGSLAAAASDYDVAFGVVSEINSLDFSGEELPFVVANVISNGTHAEFDNNVTVTNASRTVTFATDSSYGGGATALVVGDFIQLQGFLFEVTAVASATSVTIDRAYTGTTETIVVGSTTNVATRVTSITEYGIRLEASNNGEHFRLAVGEVLEDADISYTTPFNPGSGTYAQIAQLEKDFTGASRGSWNKVGPYASFGAPTLFADSSATYDMFNIMTVNQNSDKTGMNARIGTEINVIVASHASATGVNSALDTIVAAI